MVVVLKECGTKVILFRNLTDIERAKIMFLISLTSRISGFQDVSEYQEMKFVLQSLKCNLKTSGSCKQ